MKLRYSTKFYIGVAMVASGAAFAFGAYVSEPAPPPAPIPVYILPANGSEEEVEESPSPTPSPKPTPSVKPATTGGPISPESPEAGGNTGGSIVRPTGNTAPLKPPTKGTGK